MTTTTMLWRGRSRLDGAPIVVLGSEQSANRKTGPMSQTWILRADIDPSAASHARADRSICGRCPFGPGRPVGTPRGCYVAIGRAPLAVWRAWHEGRARDTSTPQDRSAWGSGRGVRLGAYGDPAAVPPDVWGEILDRARYWTGYTSQWADGFALREWCMASTRSDAESDAAIAGGWRVYQATAPDAPRRPGFAVCPYVTSSGRLQCCDCRMCDGDGDGIRDRVHVQAPVHGVHWMRSAALRVVTPQGGEA